VAVGVGVGVVEHLSMTTNVAMKTSRIDNSVIFIIRAIFAYRVTSR